ncbi:hypothetical protein [Cellvibrio sp. OA-2007]|uniref:hypothetical protein n=1 Tax=Cellvibrio sp. OA-2007 TaxID=529823 RepID=UPI000784A378|nr:hypothetical protein [Cellvibrio sp. OA-2007]
MSLMEFNKLYLKPLTAFAIGLLLIIAIDFAIRHFTGTLNTLGLPETLWFSLQLLTGIFASILFWKNTAQKSIPIRLAYYIPLLLAFLIFYTLIIYVYVIETAIDGF